ncbi:MAG: hypothetical protein J6Z34_04170 [Clostridia bacterium]|nr:hypothetical protein [Clostridia bacterium]
MKILVRTEVADRPIIKPCNVNVEAVWAKFANSRRVSEEINEYLTEKREAEKTAAKRF